MGGGGSKGQLSEALEAIQSHDIKPDDADFWSQLWDWSTTRGDMFLYISPDTVRRLRAERPKNVAALFTQAVAHLCQVVETPSTTYFEQALNCIRLLTRLMPLLLEGYRSEETGEVDPFLHKLFWENSSEEEEDSAEPPNRRPPSPYRTAPSRPQPPSKLGREGGAGGERGEKQNRGATEENMPLGHILCGALMQLLFLKGFTCEAAVLGDVEGEETPDLMVMLLMIALMSEPLYMPSSDPQANSSAFGSALSSATVPHSPELFTSLMNVVLSYDPIGWGVPFAGKLVSDLPAQQADVASQLLVILLDVGKPPLPVITNFPDAPGPGGDPNTGVREEAPQPGQEGYNLYRNMLNALMHPDDMRFVVDGIIRLLNSGHESKQTVIPGSREPFDTQEAILVLLWKLIEENLTFTSYLLEHSDINQLVVPLCYLLLVHRKDPTRSGLMHINTFILLKLSGERNFGVSLNKPCTVKLPVDVPLFTGTHADLLVVTLHKLVVSGSDRLSSLYHCFLTVIANVSPYCKSLSLVASVKMVNLFELFTSPQFLYSAQANHTYVLLLVESFNNVIQYQYTGNPHLTYAIVRRRKLFESLSNLTLEAAIAAAKQEAGSGIKSVPPASEPSPMATREICRGAGGAEEDVIEEASPVRPPPTVQRQSRATEGEQAGAAANEVITVGRLPDDALCKVIPPFLPNEEWLALVKPEAALNTILRLIGHLAPQLDHACKMGKVTNEAQVLDFITNTTMVGLLPVPHPIIIRRYQPNYYTKLWFSSFLWGVVFVKNQGVNPLFDGEAVRLFTVTTQP